MENNEYSPCALAYLGDCVLEIQTRTRLVKTGISDAGKLNSMALSYVKASAQSAAFSRIEPILKEDELAWFKRGRNNHTMHIPKSASPADYRRATGLEVLFGWLHICGEYERIDFLFNTAFPDGEA